MVTLAKLFIFSKGVHIMKIDLVKINLGDSYKYKFKRYEPCCDDILDNPCISFTNYNLMEETPDNEPRYCLASLDSSDDVAWEDNYPIKFCPHCGEPIEIKTVKVIDCSEKFSALAKKREELLKRIRAFRNSSKSDNTLNDNKHPEKSLEELHDELLRVNKKINYIQTLSLYEEEKLEYNFKLD